MLQQHRPIRLGVFVQAVEVSNESNKLNVRPTLYVILWCHFGLSALLIRVKISIMSFTKASLSLGHAVSFGMYDVACNALIAPGI